MGSPQGILSSGARYLGALLTGVVGALVILTTVGFLGSVWWIFDLASHFRVQYLVLLAPAVLILAVLGWWRASAAGGLALLLNLALLLPLFGDRPAEAQGVDRLQVLSFNVTASNPDRTAVVEYLERSEADVIFLHESSTDWEDALSRADLSYRIVSAREPGSLFGTVALVGPDDAGEVLALGNSGQWSVVVTTRLAGRPVKILGTHPLSPIGAVRSTARDEQLGQIGEWAARQSSPVAVVGDFNASPWSHGFSLVARPAGLVNSQRGFGVQASWPVGLPLFRVPIDHLLHSSELTTVERSLGEELGSDHFPLLVTLGRAAD